MLLHWRVDRIWLAAFPFTTQSEHQGSLVVASYDLSKQEDKSCLHDAETTRVLVISVLSVRACCVSETSTFQLNWIV